MVLRRFSMMVYRLFGHRLGGGYILKQNEGGPSSLSSPILFTKGCSCFPEIALDLVARNGAMVSRLTKQKKSAKTQYECQEPLVYWLVWLLRFGVGFPRESGAKHAGLFS